MPKTKPVCPRLRNRMIAQGARIQVLSTRDEHCLVMTFAAGGFWDNFIHNTEKILELLVKPALADAAHCKALNYCLAEDVPRTFTLIQASNFITSKDVFSPRVLHESV